MQPNYNPNLLINPFSDFDDDEYEQAMEMGDRFFGVGKPKKPLSKAEQDKENFVTLNDNYGEYLDPESILAIFNQCGRDMDQTISTIEDVIGSSNDVIGGDFTDGTNSANGLFGNDSGSGSGGDSALPCEFWADNGWCVRGCTHHHETAGFPCVYYNKDFKFCSGGKKCKFLHTTIEEQLARMRADEDDQELYMNYDDMYKYDKLDKAFANFLRQVKDAHPSVFGPLVDSVFDYM